jgi:asparagine synthase (glutamine-hydrolysing)
MPGLVGVFSHAAAASSELQRMRSELMHEPSYGRGEFSDARLGLHVGWTHHVGSAQEVLPLWNAGHDVCLIFHGEDFSQPTDTGLRYLLALYEAHGADFVARLNGSFCGVLIDQRQHCVLLFNDRYGASRLYWHQTEQGLYFASEAKALLCLFAQTRRLDVQAVAQTFSFGCVLQNRSLFSGLSLLPAASRWTFRGPLTPDKHTYFSPATWQQQTRLAPAPFYEQLQSSFATLLPRYLRGPGACAMSLTGGLDGRMVMAWAPPHATDLACYSFGGPYRDCHDVRLARRIAMHAGSSHRTLSVDAGFLASFAKLAAQAVYLSDGTMDVSGAVELYVNRLARDIAPIRLTGNYGSEVLRSNVAFRPRRLDAALFDADFFAQIEAAASAYASERQGPDLSFIAFKQVPWHHHARLSLEQSQLTVRSPFLDNDLVALMHRAPSPTGLAPQTLLQLIHDGDPALARLPTDRGWVHGRAGLTQRWQQRLREFSAKAEYAYDYGMPQWLARVDQRLSALQLERLFLGRHKFYHFRTWYRHALAPFVQEVLLDPGSLARSYFAPGVQQMLVEQHISGRGNYTLEIHRALTLELLQRELLDRYRRNPA